MGPILRANCRPDNESPEVDPSTTTRRSGTYDAPTRRSICYRRAAPASDVASTGRELPPATLSGQRAHPGPSAADAAADATGPGSTAAGRRSACSYATTTSGTAVCAAPRSITLARSATPLTRPPNVSAATAYAVTTVKRSGWTVTFSGATVAALDTAASSERHPLASPKRDASTTVERSCWEPDHAEYYPTTSGSRPTGPAVQSSDGIESRWEWTAATDDPSATADDAGAGSGNAAASSADARRSSAPAAAATTTWPTSAAARLNESSAPTTSTAADAAGREPYVLVPWARTGQPDRHASHGAGLGSGRKGSAGDVRGRPGESCRCTIEGM